MPEPSKSDKLERALNGHYATLIIACTLKGLGFTICTREGKCSTYPYALVHLNPETALYTHRMEGK